MVVVNILNKIKERRRSSHGRTRSYRNSRSSSSGSCGMAIENCGSLNLLMLGNENVGKTTICSRYVLDNIYGIDNNLDGEELFESSIFFSPKSKTEKIRQYDLHITIGQDRHERESVERYKQQITNCDGCVLVYSKDDRQSYMKLVELISDIRKLKKEDIPIIIIGNKTDLKQQSYTHVQETCVLGGYAHFDASALENDGIQEAFRFLVQLCIEDI